MSSVCNCISLHLLLAYVNHHEALVASKGYHVIITASSRENRKARRLEGNTGKDAGGGRGNKSGEEWWASTDTIREVFVVLNH